MRKKAGKKRTDDIGRTSDTRLGLNLNSASVFDVLFPRALAESSTEDGPDMFIGHLRLCLLVLMAWLDDSLRFRSA